jgi:hypothetical protein
MSAPYGQQPYYPPPREGIAITTGYAPLAWVYALIKPKIFLNGHEVPSWGWGRSVVPTRAGQYHVHVHVPYLLPSRMGPADFTAAVAPGQLVELEYKAPLFTFSRGSLGPPPQRYNGLGAVLAIMSAALVVMLTMGVLAVVFS